LDLLGRSGNPATLTTSIREPFEHSVLRQVAQSRLSSAPTGRTINRKTSRGVLSAGASCSSSRHRRLPMAFTVASASSGVAAWRRELKARYHVALTINAVNMQNYDLRLARVDFLFQPIQPPR
jgi:hypothetical protein